MENEVTGTKLGGAMKTVILLSPDYLDDLFNESEKYSFTIHGYGNPNLASRGLLYVNASEILGFAAVFEMFPTEGSVDFMNFLSFVKKCDLLGIEKKFVIVSRSKIPIQRLQKEVKWLKVEAISDLDFLTDTIINKSIFGNILLDNYEPYQIHPEVKMVIGELESPTLSYTPAVPEFATDVFKPVNKMDNWENTVKYDQVIQKYRDVNILVVELRKLYILSVFGLESSKLILSIVGRISELKGTAGNWYSACLYKIGGKVY